MQVSPSIGFRPREVLDVRALSDLQKRWKIAIFEIASSSARGARLSDIFPTDVSALLIETTPTYVLSSRVVSRETIVRLPFRTQNIKAYAREIKTIPF